MIKGTKKVKVTIEIEVPDDCEAGAVDENGTVKCFSDSAAAFKHKGKWLYKSGCARYVFFSKGKETYRKSEEPCKPQRVDGRINGF